MKIQSIEEYNTVVRRLEEILAKVEDPSTPLPEMDICLKECSEKVDACRAFIRSEREKLQKTTD